MTSKRNFWLSSIIGTISGANLALGIENLMFRHSAIDSIRDAVYSHADKITPEVIEQANRLVSEVGAPYSIEICVNFAVAGFAAACSYFLARNKDDPRVWE